MCSVSRRAATLVRRDCLRHACLGLRVVGARVRRAWSDEDARNEDLDELGGRLEDLSRPARGLRAVSSRVAPFGASVTSENAARPAGFEPATCGLEVRRSIQAELRAP